MLTRILFKGIEFHVDLFQPIDISIPVRKENNVTCWYQGPPKIEPVHTDTWIGEVSAGAPVNFRNIFFNPHAHGTHTECLGHITPEWNSVFNHQTLFFFTAELITLLPTELPDGDRTLMPEPLKTALDAMTLPEPQALIIRTLSNGTEKYSMQYSNTNPPYIHPEAMKLIVRRGIEHLLIDLPSVDREQDEGKLLSHKIFWNYPDNPRYNATITELIYVPNHIPDGTYLLNLMTGPFDNDAAPSRPVLYPVSSMRKIIS